HRRSQIRGRHVTSMTSLSGSRFDQQRDVPRRGRVCRASAHAADLMALEVRLAALGEGRIPFEVVAGLSNVEKCARIIGGTREEARLKRLAIEPLRCSKSSGGSVSDSSREVFGFLEKVLFVDEAIDCAPSVQVIRRHPRAEQYELHQVLPGESSGEHER